LFSEVRVVENLDPLVETPYFFADQAKAVARFAELARLGDEAAAIATRSQSRIRNRAGKMLADFESSLRSEIVAESNRIEGYEWSPKTVKEATELHRELISLPFRAFVDGVKGDRRVFEALGLYKAHLLANEWTEDTRPPAEADIRAFHALITVGEDYAGRYKHEENSIAGSSLQTAFPLDVPRQMHGLVTWWRERGDCPPILRAAVIHAWISQIHPFADGNGRLARLLANLALAQHGFPPLLLRSTSDRGQYLDALNQADDGDILPLFELFYSVVRREVRVMARPSYVDDIVNSRLLADDGIRFDGWNAEVDRFLQEFQTECENCGWFYSYAGKPDSGAFQLLADGQSEGNGWFLRCGPANDRVAFLGMWGVVSWQK
jgi:hypothetical protein